MINTIEEYLDLLKKSLEGCDPASMRDALFDAEEFLRNGLETARVNKSELSEPEILGKVIEEFGTPEEFAQDYRKIEARIRPTFAPTSASNVNPSLFNKIFGIFADPAAWSSLLFMLVSLVTGIIYFTWAVTGLSLSVGLLVLIISLPFIGLFFLSVRGIALIEGRIVEALLGVRMPRRPIFVDNSLGWWGRFKLLSTSRHTWLTLVYMILMLPLGVIYFSVFITLISLALGLIAAPVAQWFFPYPILTIGTTQYYSSPLILLIFWLVGFAIAVGTLHLARLIGRWHGSMAKAILVGD